MGRRISSLTHPMDPEAMEAFFDYVTRFDPDFRSRIRGATAAEIAHLEELVGRPLPPPYRWFLENMGHRELLGVGGETTTDISAVIRVYEQLALTKRRAAPPDGILIGVNGAYYDVALQDTAEGEPRVLFTERFMILYPFAESLRKLLYRLAFRVHAPKRFPARAEFGGTDVRPRLEEFANFAAAENIQKHWFSDYVCYCGESDHVILSAQQFERQGMSLRLAASNSHELSQLVDRFQREFGLRPL
jgi:hypothetical protein